MNDLSAQQFAGLDGESKSSKPFEIVYDTAGHPDGAYGPLDIGPQSRCVTRTLALLDALSSPRPARLSELALTAGLSKATAHRMANVLVQSGFAARVGQRYALGPRIFQLTAVNRNIIHLQRLLMPFLLELFERTRGITSVGLLSQGHVHYADPLHNEIGLARTSNIVPVHCTALGKLLLAYRPSAVAALGEHDLMKSTDKTLTKIADLKEQLKGIRRRGIAISNEEWRRGEVEVAAPVFVGDQRVVTGLAVAGAIGKLDLEVAAMHVTRVADIASRHCRDGEATILLRKIWHES